MSKLIYFGVYGRGEKLRVLLSHAKVEHEDERLTFESFGPRKAAGEFNNGQVPVWIQNGKQYNESSAVLRFLGKHHGYYPSDPEEAYHADNIVDYCADVTPKLYPDQMGKKFDEEAQNRYVKNITDFSAYIEKQLAHGKKYVAGDSISIGDFAAIAVVFSYVHNDALAGGADFSDKGKKIISEHKHVAAWVDNLKGECAAYLTNRPPAPF